jgi:hypothetical protein
MSITGTPYPIVAALKAAEDFLGPNREWHSVNDLQAGFLRDQFAHCIDLIDQIPEIERIASRDNEIINKFLRERGFSLHVDPIEPLQFGIAGMLDLQVEWMLPGERVAIKTQRWQYPGVRLDSEHVQFYRAVGHPNPIACLSTKSGDRVYMTMLDEPPDANSVAQISGTQFARMEPGGNFSGLIFPMVDLNQETDISWLAGLHTVNDRNEPCMIARAQQQNRLRMSEIGARAQSAAVMELTFGMVASPPPVHVIDRPFLVWFQRFDDSTPPLFAAYVTEEDWKDPGDIQS